VTVRPTAAPADHDLWSLEPDLTIDLDVLEREDVDRLGIPELYERTGGYPRFVAEAMRTGEAAPSKSRAEALIAQCRAEGLWGCRILTTAALLEQPFDPLPLAALLDTDPGSLSEELEAFCERRILRVDGLRFRFRYAVVRDVLLESISPARRTLLLERLGANGDGARPVRDIRVAETAR
jgi:hypothetical protein